MTEADILIKNAWLITMNNENKLYSNAWLAISGTKITGLGSMDKLPEIKAKKQIDAKNGILMPGLINVHTHASMTLFRGLADDMPLMKWLQDFIFPAEAKLDREKVKLGAKLACLEMIASGTTTFSDMYLFEEGVAEAADKAKMRAVVGEVLYDFPSPAYGDIEQGFNYIEKMVEKWEKHPLIKIAIKPHSPYLCNPELLKKAFKLAEKKDLIFSIHLAETLAERKETFDRYQKSPAAHLADLGLLSEKTLAAHCVFMSREDIELFADKKAKIAHNPQSNMKLASGIAPVPDFLEAGICVGLGTDGAASNNSLNMLSELKTAALLHKVNHKNPSLLNADTMLRMATIEGARCLGLDKITGSLEEGKEADIILIQTEAPHMTPLYNPSSHIVYAAGRNDISDVFIAGRHIYENREFKTLDKDEICFLARKTALEISPSS